MSKPWTIPATLHAYMLANDCMVVAGAPSDRADQRALQAVKQATFTPRGRGHQAVLRLLADDPEAREELAAYIDSLAKLVQDRTISSREVGMRAHEIRKAASSLRSAE